MELTVEHISMDEPTLALFKREVSITDLKPRARMQTPMIEVDLREGMN